MSINLRDGLGSQPVDHVLEDLLVRFVINVPDEDLSSIERVFFQVEEAQWFYTDFVRTLNPELPSMKMKSFAPKILNKCPLLWKWGDPADALPRFGKYKSTIPVRGIAMMNKDLTKVVLLKGVESNTWSFPRGKISKGEADLECAIREAREETGFDARDYINEKDVLERTIYGKNFKIYLAKGVPEDFNFEPLVRNEIAEIRWFDIKGLSKLVKNSPNKYFVVNTLLKPLTKWINTNKGLVSDEQLMRDAEIRLKALMGISSSPQVNADAGRELLDILQGAKPQTPFSAASVSGQIPPQQQQQQFIQMSLPQHLQSVYSGFAQMPQFFPPFTQGQSQNPMVSPPEFVAPHFANARQGGQSQPSPYDSMQHPQASYPSMRKQTQTSSNSKELLSILKGASAPKTLRPSDAPPSPGAHTNTSSADELLSILKQGKPKTKKQEPVPAKSTTPMSRSETPSKKFTLLKRDKSVSDSNASATLLGILGKGPSSEEGRSVEPSEAEQPKSKGNGHAKAFLGALNGGKPAKNHPKTANDETASADILGILNGPAKEVQSPKPKVQSSSNDSSLSASTQLLSVLHPQQHYSSKIEDGHHGTIPEQPKKPIRLAKRGEGMPASLRDLFEGDKKTSVPTPQTPADLSAGNQILRFIQSDPEASKPTLNHENQDDNESFEDFENFENFEDFNDDRDPPSHIYDLIHNTLDAHTDEEEYYSEPNSHQSDTGSKNITAEISELLTGNKSSQDHSSTYHSTYGTPEADDIQREQRVNRTPSSNGADILSILRRAPQ
ncbi:hypothetical protein OXX80_008974 [Metschnikowia pulcherrima]